MRVISTKKFSASLFHAYISFLYIINKYLINISYYTYIYIYIYSKSMINWAAYRTCNWYFSYISLKIQVLSAG